MGDVSAIVTVPTPAGVPELTGAIERADVAETVAVLPPGTPSFGVDTFVRISPDEGLAAARNAGAEAASGDIYAFLDADAVPAPRWGEIVRRVFRERDVPAAGGPAYPLWPSCDGRPGHLPQVWDWLVGAGPYPSERPHRNSYGCNVAIRAAAFDRCGGFDDRFGLGGGARTLPHGEETALVQQLSHFHYEPRMAVWHRVETTGRLALAVRAFEQGLTKGRLGIEDTETSFVADAVDHLTEAPSTALWLSALAGGYAVGRGIGPVDDVDRAQETAPEPMAADGGKP